MSAISFGEIEDNTVYNLTVSEPEVAPVEEKRFSDAADLFPFELLVSVLAAGIKRNIRGKLNSDNTRKGILHQLLCRD